MNRFEEMARKVKDASDAQIADEAAKRTAERAAADEQFAADVALLEAKVRPVFDDARSAFESVGVQSNINDNWTGIGRPMHPTLTFKCEGERKTIPATGGSYTPAGIIVAVTAENNVFTIKIGKDNYDRFGSIVVNGTLEQDLDKALEQALTTYHAHVAEHAALM